MNIKTAVKSSSISQIAVFILLFLSTITVNVLAAPGRGIPDQLTEIRVILAEIQAMQAQLDAKLDTLESGVNANDVALALAHTKLDMVGLSVNEVFESVNSTEITTELCFTMQHSFAAKIGGQGEIGVGWPNVLDAKLALAVEGSSDIGVGLGNEICIQVPLYSVYVEQDESWLLPLVKDQLDDLFSTVTVAAQTVVPVMGSLYAITLPPPSAVTGVIDEIIFDPAKMFDFNTFEPLIPPLMSQIIAEAPSVAEAVILDPCGALSKAPIIGDLPPETYNWICVLEPDETLKLIRAVSGTLDGLCHLLFPVFSGPALCHGIFHP